MFVTHRKGEMWIQKICRIYIKMKIIYRENILEDAFKLFLYIYFIFKNLICYDLHHFFTNDITIHIEILKFFFKCF
jgi:hypothetical protein